MSIRTVFGDIPVDDVPVVETATFAMRAMYTIGWLILAVLILIIVIYIIFPPMSKNMVIPAGSFD